MYNRDFQNVWWKRNKTLGRIVGIVFVLHIVFLIAVIAIILSPMLQNLFLILDLFAVLLPTAIGIAVFTFLSPLRHWWSRHLWFIILSIHSIALVTMTNLYSIICYYNLSLGICDIARQTGAENASDSVGNSTYYLVLGPFLALIVFRNHSVYQTVAMAISIATYIWVIILRSNRLQSWVSVVLTLGAFGIAFAVKRVQEKNDYDAYILENKLQTEVAATKEAQRKKEIADIQKEQFTSFVFHEIRNPLNTVILSSNILDTSDSFKHSLSTDQDENFQRIRFGLSSIENVINDTLDFRRSQSGRLILENKPFDLSWTIDQSIAEVMNLKNGKPIEFVKDVDERIQQLQFKVLGDTLRIKQILVTYLSNAFKYTHRGTVKLTVKHEGLEVKDRLNLYVSVKDTGVGLTEESVRKMFKPFVQVRSDSGTGLGLAISANIIQLMGGTFGVESTVNEGSLFWFKIVLSVTNERNEEKRDIVDDEPLERKLHILITDDDSITRNLMKKLLGKLGHTSDTAENGLVCTEMVSHTKYDVILLDNQMPIMNGKEALKWIRLNGYDTPIIMLTGLSEVDEQNELLDIGANYVLIKPVTMTLIDKTIKRVVV